jgi:hypothetical protein
MLASALQTAFNLHVLPSLVLTLLTDLTEAVEARVKVAFDISSLSKDATAKGIFYIRNVQCSVNSRTIFFADANASGTGLVYRSRVRTEPTNITATQWANALWARMEVMVEDMAACCIKVYRPHHSNILRSRADDKRRCTPLRVFSS